MAKYAYHRIDGNAEHLIDYWRQAGATWEPLGRPVDGLLGFRGVSAAVELKTPSGALRPSQVKFFARFSGLAVVVRTVDEAEALLRRMKAIGAQ